MEERCVEIYLHATLYKQEESADLYIYRYAEKKAIQLGKIYRILKEISIDCILNKGQKKMSVNDLNQTIELNLSTLNNDKVTQIEYKIGDKPFSSICDYMNNCDYKCYPDKEQNEIINKYTYNNDFIKNNNNIIVEKIKTLYRDKKKVVYTIEEIIYAINNVRQYPIDQIYYALSYLIKNKTEYLIDYYGRFGYLINKDIYYLFQPLEVTDENASIFERIVPVDYKQKSIVIPENYKNTAIMLNLPKGDKPDKSNYSEILKYIEKKQQIAFEGKKDNESNNSWFENLYSVLNELQNTYNISITEIKKHFIYHLFDSYSVENKLILLNNISEETDENIKEYFNSKKIKKFIVLYDKNLCRNKYFYFLSADNKWEEKTKAFFDEVLQDDANLNNEYKSKLKPKITIFNEDQYFGFMTSFRDSGLVVFKVNKPSTKDERGLYFSNGNKGDAIIIINKFLEDIKLSEKRYSNDFSKYQLSVIMEILMRLQGGNKKKFLSPEQYHEIYKKDKCDS